MNQPLAMMNQSYGPWRQQNTSQILMNPSFNFSDQSMTICNNWRRKNNSYDIQPPNQLGFEISFFKKMMMLFQSKLGWSLVELLGRSAVSGCRAPLQK